MSEIIINAETTNNFIDTLTLEQRGHLLTMIVKNGLGIGYKSGNKSTDILINAYRNITLKSDKRNTPHALYFIKIIDNVNGQMYLKIGITSNLSNRYGSFANRLLKVEELYVKEFSNKKLALINEKKLKEKFKSFAFEPTYKFGGHTECFHMYMEKDIYEYLQTNNHFK